MRFFKVLVLSAVVAGVFAATAAALRFTDDSFFTPEGEVGKPYSHTFKGEGGCGPGLPYQYRVVNGALPHGLSLSSGGVVSGTPSSPGSFSFWVVLSDENPPSASWCIPTTAEREFTINIGAALTIQQNAIPVGTRNAAYDTQLSAAGGGTLAWSVQSGSLPPGINFDPATQRLGGIPTQSGTYQFVVLVKDSKRSDTETLTLTVRDPLAITTPVFPSSEVGVPFEAKLEVTGGVVPVTALRARTRAAGKAAYTLTVTGLPPGLTADAAGAITGTPEAGGTFPVTINASDEEGRTATLVARLIVAPKLAITSKRLGRTKAGRPYRFVVKTRGGVAPLKWGKLTGRLPTGIRFDRATGTFSGQAKKAGDYTVNASAKDALKVAAEQALVLTVEAAPKKKKK